MHTRSVGGRSVPDALRRGQVAVARGLVHAGGRLAHARVLDEAQLGVVEVLRLELDKVRAKVEGDVGLRRRVREGWELRRERRGGCDNECREEGEPHSEGSETRSRLELGRLGRGGDDAGVLICARCDCG